MLVAKSKWLNDNPYEINLCFFGLVKLHFSHHHFFLAVLRFGFNISLIFDETFGYISMIICKLNNILKM